MYIVQHKKSPSRSLKRDLLIKVKELFQYTLKRKIQQERIYIYIFFKRNTAIKFSYIKKVRIKNLVSTNTECSENISTFLGSG